MTTCVVLAAAGAGALGGGAGCTETPALLTRAQLEDPKTCGTCHEDHYREWSGSMHAYAGEDPLFLAMNARFQRETAGTQKDFCVKCHAPVALANGLTVDGTNLAELPAAQKGVTCYFCHTQDRVEQLHNNGLRAGDPQTMLGGIVDPVANDAHKTGYSRLFDQKKLESSDACGSCHDIVAVGGAHIERTFAEWKGSLFANETGQTCSQCHMKASTAPRPAANVPGVPARTVHAHTFAGVDRAITPFPNVDEQRIEIQDLLDTSIQASLCVARRGGSSELRVVLDNVFAGHSFPSGAAADRRVWVELVGYAAGAEVYRSGVVPNGTVLGQDATDADLWLLRDEHFDAAGKVTHVIGTASCYVSDILPFPVTANRSDPRFYQRNIVRAFPREGLLPTAVDRVTMRVRILPVALEVLDDLVASGDLAPEHRATLAERAMQVGPELVWTPGAANGTMTERGNPTPFECVTRTNQDFRADKFPPPTESTCAPR